MLDRNSVPHQDPDDPVEDFAEVDPGLSVQQPTEGIIHRPLGPASVATVLTLAAPTIVEQIFTAVVGLTDTVIAGHLPGDDHLRAAASAAVGTVSYFQWFAGLMTSAFAVGAMAIVSRSIGRRRYRRANRTSGTALVAAFAVGVLVAIVLYAFAPQVMRATGLHGLPAEYGVRFLRIMTITISLQTAAQIGLACLRGAGDTLRPMLVTGMVVIINVFTSASFGLGWFGMPAWGVEGIAFGTMIAYLVGGTATLGLLMSGLTRLRLRPRHLKPSAHVLARVLRIGMPSWLEHSLLWLGQYVIVVLIINPTDAAIGVEGVTMAAHNAVLRIESIAFLPGFGFGIAASAMVGQYLGAGRSDEAKRATHLANRLAFITMTLAALPMVLIPQQMLSLLVDSAPVVQTGHWPMVLAGLAQPGFAIAIIMASGLKGAGETVWPMGVTITGMFLVRVPLLLAFVWIFTRMGHPGWGLIAVWIGILVDLYYRGLANAWVFWQGKWMLKKV